MAQPQTYTTISGEVRNYDDASRVDMRRSRRNPETPRVWQVSEMYDRTHEVARRLLLGQKNVEIAADLNISSQQVSNIKNSPVVREKLSLMQAARDVGSIDLAQEIMDLAPVALKRIKEALEEGKVLGKEVSANQILGESNKLLDRHIGKAVQRVDSRSVNAHLSMDDIERIKQRAVELADASGQLGGEG